MLCINLNSLTDYNSPILFAYWLKSALFHGCLVNRQKYCLLLVEMIFGTVHLDLQPKATIQVHPKTSGSNSDS